MRHSQLSNSLNAMLMPRAKLTAHALKLKLLQKLTQRNLRFALIEKGCLVRPFFRLQMVFIELLRG
jgi:hypothetical protein